jgi:hypothetical protein
LEFPPIPVGTIFVVPIGSARILGAVHASGGDRIFCTVIGPPMGAGWEPQYEIRGIVEDLALRDGSWEIREKPADFEPAAFPRFASRDEDARDVLLTLDPASLLVAETAVVETDDERAEWEGSPRWVGTDITTFERSLAITMNIDAPELESQPSDAAEHDSRFVVAMARAQAKDLSRQVPVTHLLIFNDRRAAQRAAHEARSLGLAPSLDAPWYARQAKLKVNTNSLAAYPDVREQIRRIQTFAERFGAEYDGFEMHVP